MRHPPILAARLHTVVDFLGSGTAQESECASADRCARARRLLCRVAGYEWRHAVGWAVAVAVHNSPLPVLPPIDVGNAKRVGGRGALDLDPFAFVADGVGKVAAGTGCDDLELVGLRVGEP